MRLLLSLLSLSLLAGSAPAQEKAKPKRLAVHPAAAPVPALKYRLLPEVRDLKPGNAVLLYYRAFSPEWLTHTRPEMAKQLAKWDPDQPEPPDRGLRWVLNYQALGEIDRAARRTYCDWAMIDRVREDAIGVLLPDVQALRGFTNVLALRARFQIEDGKFDDAVYSFQTGLAMSRHVADAPTLIQALVGMALAQVTLAQVEQFIQRPGAPNLYWSLTNLPRPFIDLRRPLEGERLFIDSFFPELRETIKEAKTKVLTPAEIEAMLRKVLPVLGLSGFAGKGKGDWQKRLGVAVLAAKVYPDATKTLAEVGYSPEQVEKMPVLQAALLYEIVSYDRVYDDFLKWYGLPYWQARPGIDESIRRFKEETQTNVGLVLARLLVPAVEVVIDAGVRVDRRIAALRTVEALRLYAAAHDGKLPEKLEDIQEVPLPLDPKTGKPFEYRLEGGKAIVYGEPHGKHPSNAIYYEITLKK